MLDVARLGLIAVPDPIGTTNVWRYSGFLLPVRVSFDSQLRPRRWYSQCCVLSSSARVFNEAQIAQVELTTTQAKGLGVRVVGSNAPGAHQLVPHCLTACSTRRFFCRSGSDNGAERARVCVRCAASDPRDHVLRLLRLRQGHACVLRRRTVLLFVCCARFGTFRCFFTDFVRAANAKTTRLCDARRASTTSLRHFSLAYVALLSAVKRDRAGAAEFVDAEFGQRDDARLQAVSHHARRRRLVRRQVDGCSSLSFALTLSAPLVGCHLALVAHVLSRTNRLQWRTRACRMCRQQQQRRQTADRWKAVLLWCSSV